MSRQPAINAPARKRPEQSSQFSIDCFQQDAQVPSRDAPLRATSPPVPEGFGHFGAGGSLGFCDPEAGLAFGYVANQMGPRWQNPRNRALIDAVYSSLSATSG